MQNFKLYWNENTNHDPIMTVDALKVNQSNLTNTLSNLNLYNYVHLSIKVATWCGRENEKNCICPECDTVCHKCHKKGHYTVNCSSRSAAVVNVTVTLFSKHIWDYSCNNPLSNRV